MKQALITSRLFDGDNLHQGQAILVSDGIIDEVVPRREVPRAYSTIDLGRALVAPGFIDVQVNGGGGVLLNNQPDIACVETVTTAHCSAGTTGLLPTIISDSREVMEAAAEAVIAVRRAGSNTGVLGLHLEGPFIAEQRRGAHSANALRRLNTQDIVWLQRIGEQLPTVLTLAPE